MKTVYSINELVQFAVQIEKNGEVFYANAAEKTKNKEAKEIYQFLRNAEQEHEKRYAKILTNVNKTEHAGTVIDDDYNNYLKALVTNVVFNSAPVLPDNDAEVIDYAIGKEKDSILFYMEMSKAVAEQHLSIIEEIILEEQMHILKLVDLKESIN